MASTANVVAARAAAAAARAAARAGSPLMAAAEAKPPSSPEGHPQADGDDDGGLRFSCDFESGNIGEVQQLNEVEYEISIRPDSNNARYRVWFFFSVRGGKKQQRARRSSRRSTSSVDVVSPCSSCRPDRSMRSESVTITHRGL